MKKIKPEGPEREDNLSPVTLPVTGHCYLSPLLIQYYRRARAIYILSSPPPIVASGLEECLGYSQEIFLDTLLNQ